MVGVSSWKKGHYASSVPLPSHEHTWIKAKNKMTFSLYFASGKGLVSYGTPLCPLFRKSRYSAYYGCSKNYFVSFLLYIDLVFCFFSPEKQFSGTV